MYYLRSRYYSSGLCRFINADGILGTVGSLSNRNVYVYCENVITSLHDPDGNIHGDVSTPLKPNYTLGSFGKAGGGAVVLIAAGGSLFNTFQRWAESIKQAWNTFRGISSAITVATALTAEEAITQSLQYSSFWDELKNAKAKGNANQNTPTCPVNMHHIIAQTDPAALIAREIWVDECHLSIHHPDNIVAVSTKMHWYMHTPAYFASVNSIVVFASALPGDEKENVRTAVRLIALAITTVDCGIQ